MPLADAVPADWPEPLEIRNADSAAEIVLVCDHASNHIPGEYKSLGLAGADLQRHIAWDIGAAAVTRDLSDLIGAPAVLGTYSRLLVDLNRPFASKTSIPLRSELTPIPGNFDLPPQDTARRKSRVFDPFHAGIAALLDKRQAAGMRTRIVAIHSFTPVFLGVSRPWHVGILHEHSADYAGCVIAGLSKDPSLIVGANVPYVIDRDEDYAIPVHGTDRGLEALLVEIRNDLIQDDAGVREWSQRLAAVL